MHLETLKFEIWQTRSSLVSVEDEFKIDSKFILRFSGGNIFVSFSVNIRIYPEGDRRD